VRPTADKRRHRGSFLEPDIGVELVGENRLEVVTEEFRFGPVDDANGALEPWL